MIHSKTFEMQHKKTDWSLIADFCFATFVEDGRDLALFANSGEMSFGYRLQNELDGLSQRVGTLLEDSIFKLNSVF